MSIVTKYQLINECLEAGKFYLDTDYYTDYQVRLYYHPNYAREFTFETELAYEMFIAKIEKYNGYKDFELFKKECDYSMSEREDRFESFYAAALK